MPFRSRSQLRKFGSLVKQGKISQSTFNEWLKSTPSIKRLPNRVKKQKRSKKRKK